MMEIKREELFLKVYNPLGIPIHIVARYWFGVSHLIPLLYFLSGQATFYLGAAIFHIVYGTLGMLGTTVGCHRHWTHKSFKANLPLRILLMLLQTITGQLTIHKWCLDHRIHHKFVDTNADPHNSTRGFWFSHIGWLLNPKHKDFQEKLKTFDMSDLESDPVVRFQSRWYWTLSLFIPIVFPTVFGCYVWDLRLVDSVAYGFIRYITTLHITFCVNSVAHIWGDKPYDKSISSTDNQLVTFFAVGEAWHNYHHVFPWDYRTSEFGWKYNLSSIFIDCFAKIGWASELKTVPQDLIEKRRNRTGNIGPEKYTNKEHETNVGKGDFYDKLSNPECIPADEGFWGWDDQTIPDDLRQGTKIL